MEMFKTIALVGFIMLQVPAHESFKNISNEVNFNRNNSTTKPTMKIKQKPASIKHDINNENVKQIATSTMTIAVSSMMTPSKAKGESANSTGPFISTLSPVVEGLTYSTKSPPTSSSSFLSTSAAALSTPTEDPLATLNQYCSPSLCEFYNGSHINVKPHIACENSGNFGPACGLQPHLLKMSERQRNLILDLHNLARSRIASGQVDGYKSASHMPQLKWDTELEYLASLHVKRCRFEHDSCHNTLRFPYSGQNIGYFWKAANITSHSKRMKNFIVNWYNEHKDANQTFIDSFHLHPEEKTIGHFTAMVGDRVHHIGCAVIRFYALNLTQILMTCNYDYNNFQDEPVYETGPSASKCTFNVSKKYPGLCDWQLPVYEYEAVCDDTTSSDTGVYRT